MSKIKLKTTTKRILSLDVFRGLTIVLMIIVNSPGTRTPYPILAHVDWNGCSFADLVFPSFLFIVGLTTFISLKKQSAASDRSQVYAGIVQRTIILFILGLLLNAFPYFNFHTLRVYGILQRIAVCYFICALLCMHSSFRTQLFIFLGILLGYWVVMTQVPVPGFGANQLTPSGSWVAYVDQLFFSANHLFAKVYDPEGFFSTIPSIATTLAGVLTGYLISANLSKEKIGSLLAVLGCISLAVAWLWSYDFPINKNLWTSSFVLWTTGFSLLGFAFCFWIIDIAGYTSWALPLKIFGMNALFAFVLHVFLLKTQSIFSAPLRNGTPENLRIALTDQLFGGFTPQNAALLYSLCFLALNFLIVAYLYRRNIFIRI